MLSLSNIVYHGLPAAAAAGAQGSGGAGILKDKMLQDPVGKLRVANPETLIDTDFEYGLQTTKWETLETVNNIPTFYARDNDPSMPVLSVETKAGDFNIYVTLSEPHGLIIGTPIIVQGLLTFSAEGTYLVKKIISDVTFSYTSKQAQATTQVISTESTSIFTGRMYQGTQYSMSAMGSVNTRNDRENPSIEVDLKYPHGFSANTSFVLSRSVGYKQIDVSGCNIDIRNVITSNIDFTPTQIVDSNAKYDSMAVNINAISYKRASTFDATDVSSSTISVPNHELFSSNDYVMYVPAQRSTTKQVALAEQYYANKHQIDSLSNITASNYVGYTADFGDDTSGIDATAQTWSNTSVRYGNNTVYNPSNLFWGGRNATTFVTSSNLYPLVASSVGSNVTTASSTTPVKFNTNGTDTNMSNMSSVYLGLLRGTFHNTTTSANTIKLRVCNSANLFNEFWTSNVGSLGSVNLGEITRTTHTFTSGIYKYFDIVSVGAGAFSNVGGTVLMAPSNVLTPSLRPLPYSTFGADTFSSIPSGPSNVDFRGLGDGLTSPLTHVIRVPQSGTAWLTCADGFVTDSSNVGTLVRMSNVTTCTVHDGNDMMNREVNGTLLKKWFSGSDVSSSVPTSSNACVQSFDKYNPYKVENVTTFAHTPGINVRTWVSYEGWLTPKLTGIHNFAAAYDGYVMISLKVGTSAPPNQPGSTTSGWRNVFAPSAKGTNLTYTTSPAQNSPHLVAGQRYEFRVLYCEETSQGDISPLQIWWAQPGGGGAYNEVPFNVFSSVLQNVSDLSLTGSYYYWGQHSFVTQPSKPSVFHLVVAFHMANQSQFQPNLISPPANSTSTTNRSLSALSLLISAGAISPAYVVSTTLTRAAGVLITDAEIDSIARVIMKKYASFLSSAYDSIDLPFSGRFGNNVKMNFLQGKYSATGFVGPKPFDRNRVYADGVALPLNRCMRQDLRAAVTYASINSTPQLMMFDLRASWNPASFSLRVVDSPTGCSASATVIPPTAWSFTASRPESDTMSSRRCKAFYWGVVPNSTNGGLLIHVIVCMRQTTSSSDPDFTVSTTANTHDVQDHVFTCRTPTVYIFKAMISRPNEAGTPSAYATTANLRALTEALAAYGMQLIGRPSGYIENSLAYSSVPIGGLVPYKVYRAVAMSDDAVKLAEADPNALPTAHPQSASVRLKHNLIQTSQTYTQSLTYRYLSFNVTTTHLDFDTMRLLRKDIQPRIVMYPSTLYSGTVRRNYSIGVRYTEGGVSKTLNLSSFSASTTRSMGTTVYLLDYLSSLRTDTPRQYTGIYLYRNSISFGDSETIDQGFLSAHTIMYAPTQTVSTTPITLTPADESSMSIVNPHALVKVIPVESASLSTGTINLLRKNTDTMSILLNDQMTFFVDHQSVNRLYRSPVSTAWFPFGGGFDTYTVASLSTSANSTAISLKLNGNSVQMTRQIPNRTWAVVGSRLTEKMFTIPNHGMETGDVVKFIEPATALTIPVSLSVPFDRDLVVRRVSADTFAIDDIQYQCIKDVDDSTVDTTYVVVNKKRNTFNAPNHGLFEGSTCIYDAEDPVAPLVTNTQYYVCDVESDSFRLQTSNLTPSAPIDLTGTVSASSDHKLYLNGLGSCDGTFVVSDSTPTSMTLTAPFVIPPRRMEFIPRNAINVKTNSIRLLGHRMSTGSKLEYRFFGETATPISPLTDGINYYAIIIDSDTFQIAENYTDALGGIPITLTNIGTGDNHVFMNYAIAGNVLSTETVTTLGTTVLGRVNDLTRKPVTKFLSETKMGSVFTMEIGDPLNVDYKIYAVDPVSYLVTLTSAVTFPATEIDPESGDSVPRIEPIVFAATVPNTSTNTSTRPLDTAVTGISADQIAYAVVQGSQTLIKLFATVDNARANSNPIALTSMSGTSVGGSASDKTVALPVYISLVRAKAIVKGTITDISNDGIMTLDSIKTSTGLPYTGGDLAASKYLIETNLLVKNDGYAMHRPYDGGVEMLPSNNSDSQMIRQTRKYFRYQSGKGIQCSMAINFSAPLTAQAFVHVDQATAASSAYAEAYDLTYTETFQSVFDTTYDDALVANPTATEEELTAVATSAATAAATSAATAAGNAASAAAVAYGKMTFRRPHFLSPGSPISIETRVGAEDNSVLVTDWTLNATVSSSTKAASNDLTFVWPAGRPAPSSASAPGFTNVYVTSWSGSKVRCGLFDDQNGIFYEYDGDDLYVVRRRSTQQMTGNLSVTFNSPVVTGDASCKFTSQTSVGSFIVIKGQSYKVVSIGSDRLMYVQPVYRGTTNPRVIASLVIDTRIKRSDWDDPCDGTGQSGYVLDIHNVQMIYMDYSWYGAGKVRFGMRSTDGEIVILHTIVHNNRLTESFMRSGNLPARYEIKNLGMPTYVPPLLHWGTSVIMDGRFDDDKAYYFTANGHVLTFVGNKPLTTGTIFSSVNVVDAKWTMNKTFLVYDTSSGSNVIAYAMAFPIANYSSLQNIRSGTLISSVSGTFNLNSLSTNYSGQILFYSSGSSGATAQTTRVVSQPVQYNATWGLLYISTAPATVAMSGQSVVTKFTNCSASIGNVVEEIVPTRIPLISMRLAPSVDNSLTGALGVREVINRMQLLLKDVGVLTSHDCEITLLLNSYPSKKAWVRVDSPSLSQLLVHDKNDELDGGTVVFSFRVSGGTPDSAGKRIPNNTVQDISDLVTLGNSVLGGDGIFPDGPDMLTVCASPLDLAGINVTAPFTITSRITWTESQA